MNDYPRGFNRKSHDREKAWRKEAEKNGWAPMPVLLPPVSPSVGRSARPDLKPAFDQGLASARNGHRGAQETNTEPDHRVATSGADPGRTSRDPSASARRARPGSKE